MNINKRILKTIDLLLRQLYCRLTMPLGVYPRYPNVLSQLLRKRLHMNCGNLLDLKELNA